MLTVQREYLFQAPQDARLVYSRNQGEQVFWYRLLILTFKPAITRGSSYVNHCGPHPNSTQIPPPSNIQAYRCRPAKGLGTLNEGVYC